MAVFKKIGRFSRIRLYPHPLEFILPLLYSKVLGEVERTHNDFNEFSSHPWHILLGYKLLIIIIHEVFVFFIVFVIILCFAN